MINDHLVQYPTYGSKTRKKLRVFFKNLKLASHFENSEQADLKMINKIVEFQISTPYFLSRRDWAVFHHSNLKI
jgi:hypothetical protein